MALFVKTYKIGLNPIKGVLLAYKQEVAGSSPALPTILSITYAQFQNAGLRTVAETVAGAEPNHVNDIGSFDLLFCHSCACRQSLRGVLASCRRPKSKRAQRSLERRAAPSIEPSDSLSTSTACSPSHWDLQQVLSAQHRHDRAQRSQQQTA